MDFGFLNRLSLGLACLLGCVSRQVAAEDVVHLSSPSNRQARSRISGEVVEYTGRQLVVKLADGREIKRPGQQVVAIETEWPAGKAEGDRFFDEHQFQSAREKYVAAVRKESRPWARRAIMARVIACYRELNQFEAAGKLFLALLREDPETPYFDEIPLAWPPVEPSPTLLETARQWLADDNPLAGLLGASHLLSTPERQSSLDRLSRLAAEKDQRIASLAEAQAWRAAIPAAGEDQCAPWERRVESFPDALRAGPYWVLGRALAQHGETERALLAFLHVPIVYPQARLLAADALHAAAQLLEKMGDQPAALRLCRELVDHYPESSRAAEVKDLVGAPAPQRSNNSTRAQADGIQQAFLAGLRERRLFALAEQWCRQRLATTDLDVATRADLAIELSRTLTEHALHEKQADREQLWAEALAAVGETAGQLVTGPRKLLLDSQRALVHLAHGELARQEAELAGSASLDGASLDGARQELRTAVGLLRATSKAISSELRRTNQARRAEPGDLSANELVSLQRNIDYQLARAFRNQGESYPAKSADRTNSLRQAVEQLQTVAAGDASDAIGWLARTDEVRCLRLLENFDAATGRLNALDEQKPPPTIAATLRAEQIRLLLDQHRLVDAVAAADKAGARHSERTADIDYACLEAYVAAWRAASKADRATDATQWQDRAAALIGEIDQRYGRYWSRRAEMLLASSVTRGGNTQNLALLVRAAESLYRSGQLDQALEAFDRAARQAADSKQPAAAFDHAYTAAAIAERRGQHADAARRFRAVALDQAENAKAGDAHLLAIYNTAQAAKQGGQEASSRAYLDLLTEHLDHWPRSSTANQARLWLGGFYEREARWTEAIEIYKAVLPDDPRAASAVEAVSRCYQRWLAELADSGKPTRAAALKAAAYFEGLVTNARGGLPERWSQTERVAATSAAALWLEYTDGEFARAERLLSAALAGAADASDQWKSTARTLEIFATAAQGHRDQAAQLLDQISGGEPKQMLALIERLARVAEKAPAPVERELAELELRAADLLQSRLKELPADEQRDFQRAYIRALAAVRRHDQAVEAARELAEQFPRDGQIQEQYAGLLIDSTDRANWQAALAKWRDIGQKTSQGSERWLRAMYYQSLALSRLGQADQAARLIKVTEALEPELGGAEMKAKFRAIVSPSRPPRK